MNLGMTTIFTYTDVSSIGTGLTVDDTVIIPVLFEPPVRTLRATVPEKRSHIFR